MKKRCLFFVVSLILLISSCGKTSSKSERKISEEEKAQYLKKGSEIAGATFAALGSRLQKALQDGGVENAIEYCKLAAYPIVDSLSEVHGAKIRRASFKPRNPLDKPTKPEWRQLHEYEELARLQKELKPKVETTELGKPVFFAPIKVQELCLKCHGKVGKDLSEEDFAIIKNHYPEDKAVGYEVGDLRGIWSIEFE